LSFGDGTGFWGTEGMAVPHGPNEQSSQGRCKPKPNLTDPGSMKIQQVSWRSWPATFPTDNLPAGFLLANFLSTDSSHTTSRRLSPQPEFCCPGNGCFQSKPYVRDCYCGAKNALDSASCSDPLGACRSPTYIWKACGDGYCLDTKYILCGSTTTPTPAPTSPTPPPSTGCDPNTKPNPDCSCVQGPLGGTPYWYCFDCFEGVHADIPK
jgi:hypothetical protein